jgi:hypothetical protein
MPVECIRTDPARRSGDRIENAPLSEFRCSIRSPLFAARQTFKPRNNNVPLEAKTVQLNFRCALTKIRKKGLSANKCRTSISPRS